MELSANSAAGSFLAFGQRLSKGVRSSLNALVDDLAGLSSKTQDWQVMIFIGADIEVYRRGKSAPERLAVLGKEFNEKTLAGLQRCLSASPHSRIGLRFSSDRAVTRLIALPASAQDVVSAIVRNKVESLAPWPLGEALWGFRRSQEPAQPGHINIEVGIIGRKQVEMPLRSLSKIGIDVTDLDIADSIEGSESIEIDFLREKNSDRVRKRLTLAMTWFAAAAAVCAGVGIYFAVSSLSDLDRIETRTAELQGMLRDQSASSGEGSKLSEAKKLIDRKQTEQPAMQIIESLTRLMPDDAWLETLDYEDHQLTVVGRGTSIPPIVEALEKSGVFANVNFASPTQRDAVAKVDSFSISASVLPSSATP
jgi:general secretion pathway protein L